MSEILANKVLLFKGWEIKADESAKPRCIACVKKGLLGPVRSPNG